MGSRLGNSTVKLMAPRSTEAVGTRAATVSARPLSSHAAASSEQHAGFASRRFWSDTVDWAVVAVVAVVVGSAAVQSSAAQRRGAPRGTYVFAFIMYKKKQRPMRWILLAKSPTRLGCTQDGAG
jgi:hypothetical protein